MDLVFSLWFEFRSSPHVSRPPLAITLLGCFTLWHIFHHDDRSTGIKSRYVRGLGIPKLKKRTLPCLLIFFYPKQGQWPKGASVEWEHTLRLVEELQGNMAEGMNSKQECKDVPNTAPSRAQISMGRTVLAQSGRDTRSLRF